MAVFKGLNFKPKNHRLIYSSKNSGLFFRLTSTGTYLTLHIFENHNHDLNFQDWLTQKKYSAGLKELFECAGKY